MKKSITIIGQTGVGKSTFGENISKELNLPFFDLDKEVEKNLGTTIKNAYKEMKPEKITETFISTYESLYNNKCIISVGGYFPIVYTDGMKIKQNIIYLNSSIDFFKKRIEELKQNPNTPENKNRRILLEKDENAIERHFFERHLVYASIVAETDNSYSIEINSNKDLNEAVEHFHNIFKNKKHLKTIKHKNKNSIKL